ncbi:hypothetical protein D9M70_426450 [compost metagenome]
MAVDARGVLDVGARRVLVALAKTHQRLVRPRIAIEDRDLDDARANDGLGPFRCTFDRLNFLQHIVRLDHVRIELDLERGVRRADLRDAADAAFPHALCHGQALEEGFERHLVAAFDEQMLVTSE